MIGQSLCVIVLLSVLHGAVGVVGPTNLKRPHIALIRMSVSLKVYCSLSILLSDALCACIPVCMDVVISD